MRTTIVQSGRIRVRLYSGVASPIFLEAPVASVSRQIHNWSWGVASSSPSPCPSWRRSWWGTPASSPFGWPSSWWWSAGDCPQHAEVRQSYIRSQRDRAGTASASCQGR